VAQSDITWFRKPTVEMGLTLPGTASKVGLWFEFLCGLEGKKGNGSEMRPPRPVAKTVSEFVVPTSVGLL
jgi:hypothetical protein